MIGRVRPLVPMLGALGLLAGLGAAPAPALAETRMAEAGPHAGAMVDAETLWKQGREAAESGSLDRAVGLFRQSLAVDPHGKAAMVDLATALTDLGRWDDARQTYERAVRLYPDDAIALNGLGYVHFRQDRFEAAIDCYKRALARMDDPQFHLNLGLAFLSQGRYGTAEEQFRHTLALDGGHYWAANNLGYALSLQGRRAEAAEHYWAALRLDPPGVTTHVNLGQLLLDEEAWEEAAWVYTDALKRDDASAEVHVGLAHALARLGRLDEARREALIGVRLAPDSAMAHFYLAEALYLSGDRARGIAEAERAVALDPGMASYRLVLAQMLEFKERYGEAIVQYEAFVRLAPGHADAPRARLALRLLKER